MRISGIKFFMLAVVTAALAVAPVIKSAYAAGGENPAQPFSCAGWIVVDEIRVRFAQ